MADGIEIAEERSSKKTSIRSSKMSNDTETGEERSSKKSSIRGSKNKSMKKKRRITIVGGDSDSDESKKIIGEKKSTSVIDVNLSEEIDREFAEALEDSDSSDISFSMERLSTRDTTLQNFFFEQLGEVPDLDDIELSEEYEAARKSLVSLRPSNVENVDDEGTFVDPLTGERISEEEEQSAEEPTADMEMGEEEEDEDMDVHLELPEIEEDKDLHKTLADDDTYSQFLDVHKAREEAVEDEMDVEEMAREAAARHLHEQIFDFLTKIINRVVFECEFVDKATILRANLDKRKLYEEIAQSWQIYETELRYRQFLNRKTIDYFRRKKIMRPLGEDGPDDLAKYKESLKTLDSLLGREEKLKTTASLRKSQLEEVFSELNQHFQDDVLKFENFVLNTLTNDKSDKLKTSVQNNLNKMTRIRQEISILRSLLIQRQHTLAALSEKIEKLENLGGGLSMKNFENLQTEAQALGKKIEERNTELTKLRTRFNADLHVKSHMTEKQQMLRSTVDIQELALEELLEEKQFCREYLYQLKLKRGAIRNDIIECSFRSGILDKPALMYDYDETKEKLLIVRERVEKARTKFADITAKIASLEALYRHSQTGE